MADSLNLVAMGAQPPGLLDPAQWAGWVPSHLRWGQNGPLVEWSYFGAQSFKAAFFEQDVEALVQHPFHLLFRRETSLEFLGDWQTASPGLTPSGFIFHMSRCGSTVITQMLAALAQNVVLSEAASIDFILHAHLYNPAVSEELRIMALQWLLSALGQRHTPQQQHLFVKFLAWHILDLPLLQRAFPGVPCIFVYRDPVEVLVSNLRDVSWQMMPTPVATSLLGFDLAEVQNMSLAEYQARTLAQICTVALEHAASCRLVHYRELPEAVWSWLPTYYGVDYAPAERDLMRQAAQFNAKAPGVPFKPDSQSKQRDANDVVRQLAAKWLHTPYEQLEARRLNQPQVATG